MSEVLDNLIVTYDVGAFPFPTWVQDRISSAGYDATDLHLLHETVPLREVAPLQRRLIAETADPAFQSMAHSFVRSVVQPLLKSELAIQRYFNVRIMLPDRPDMIIAFHNGTWYGHGLGETTIWMPLCEVAGSNTLMVIDRDQSRQITADSVAKRWRHEKMQEACMVHARPVEIGPGDVLLFQQENLHGNTLNTTGKTRVSIDFRVAVKGGPLHRKLIGGYFDLLDSKASASASPTPSNGGICISYVNNNTRIANGIPIHLQRLMMRDYCAAHDINPTYEQLEIEVMPHLPTLLKILEQDRPADVLLYSVYALPDAPADRQVVLDQAVSNGITLHFANEDRRVTSVADAAAIEQILTFAPPEPPA